MTAELGITNGYGVVLAADSSLTMQDHSSRKYYITGQKIFKLSSKHSVAIMFYGNATINGRIISADLGSVLISSSRFSFEMMNASFKPVFIP